MYIGTFIVCAVLQVAAVTSDCPGSSLSPRNLESDAPAHEPSPWHAVIYSKKPDAWVPLCGGTLVSPSHVVTAASCLWSLGNATSINLALLEVAVGKNCQEYDTMEEDAQLLKVKKVSLHPWFSGSASNLQRDIAVLEFNKAAILGSAVSPALIDRKTSAGGEHLRQGSSGTVAKWVGNESRSLSSVQLQYLTFRACADLVHARHGLVPSTDKFCAGAKDVMRTLCRQDFGSGYIYRHPTSNQSFLRGVLSTDLMATQFTENCHENDVAGYTNIADPLTLEWLTQIIPALAVPCSAVETSASVSFVYCHKDDVDVDCSLPMTTGTTAVSRCSTGYQVASNRKSKTSKCTSDGTWTDADVTCVQESDNSPRDPTVNQCTPSPCGLHSSCSPVSGTAVCSCLPTFIGSPPNCRPECVVSSECPQTQGCVQNKCTDVCAGACAEHAACTVVDHNPQCRCQPGYTGQARTSCTLIVPEGYQRLSGLKNLYKFHGAARLWPAAKAACEAEGSHLIVLNSEAEYRAMQDFFNQNRRKISGSNENFSFWIGVKESDVKQNEFFTVLGEPLASTGFSRWTPGEPGDLTTLGDYVHSHNSNEGLFDYPAKYRLTLAFTCELEVR